MLEEYALLPRKAEPEAVWPALPERLIRGGRMAVTPAPNLTLAKFIEVPPAARAQRARVVRFEAEQAITRPLVEVVWDWAAVPGADSTVELVAMTVEKAAELCAAAEQADVAPEAIVARASALSRALCHNYPEVLETAVLAEIEGTTVVLVRAGAGRSAVRLAALPELPAAVGADDGPAEPARGVELLRLRRLAAEMSRLADGDGGSPPSTALFLLAGPDAPEPEAVERVLADPKGVRVERFDALRRVRVGKAAAGAAAITHELGAVVGTALALRAPAAPNLLPPPRRREWVFRRNRWKWLTAVGVAAVVAWCVVAWFSWDVRRRHVEAVALTRELEPWRMARREVQERQRETELCQRELATLALLARERTGWARLLGAMEARATVAGGVWLDTVAPVGPATGARPMGLFGLPVVAPAGESAGTLRLAVTGRALDSGADGRRGLERLRTLLRGWGELERVSAVEGERFDASDPGLLRFGCVLVLKPEETP